ncbi:MAG TPA: STAS domain-containing protein [Solirubrobacteraceae bacterium]
MVAPLARIEVDSVGDCLRLALRGEVDLSNAHALQAEIQTQISELGPERVVIDLTDVDYIDSQGVMLLLEVASTLRARRAPFELVAPPGSVAGELLAISNVDLPVQGLTGR